MKKDVKNESIKNLFTLHHGVMIATNIETISPGTRHRRFNVGPAIA
jgi:hypothetical protein